MEGGTVKNSLTLDIWDCFEARVVRKDMTLGDVTMCWKGQHRETSRGGTQEGRRG